MLNDSSNKRWTKSQTSTVGIRQKQIVMAIEPQAPQQYLQEVVVVTLRPGDNSRIRYWQIRIGSEGGHASATGIGDRGPGKASAI